MVDAKELIVWSYKRKKRKCNEKGNCPNGVDVFSAGFDWTHTKVIVVKSFVN